MPTLHSATAFDAADLDGNDLLVTKSAVLVWLDAAGGYDGTAHFEFSPNRTTWFDITGEVLGEGVAAESVASPTDEAYVVRAPLNSWFRVRMSDGTQGSLTVRAQNTTVETQGVEAQSAAAAVSIANGADVAQGSTTDAAVVTDANGTISGKLRGLVKWAFERMPTSLGGKTAANSFPVTTATDDPLIVRLGEVTASPAENTVLDRLKDLLTGIILAAGENHVGQVDGYCYVPAADVAFTADTSAIIDGDVLTDTLDLGDVFRINDGAGILQSIKLSDASDLGLAMDIYFLDSNTSLGTKNSPPNISDANVVAAILGHVSVLTSDWYDLGGAKMATLRNIGLGVRAASGTKKLYASIVVRGGGTFAADAIAIRATVL